MKNKLFKIAFAALVITLVSCNQSNTDKAEYQSKDAIAEEIKHEELVKQGKYLVNALGCHDCHSPKVMTENGPMPDPKRLLSGHDANEALPAYDFETAKGYVLFTMNGTAVVGPWGTSFAGNLTPDDTGIGTWSERQFLKAMKQGKYKGLDGSRQLLPPMPWPAYTQMKDEDLKAIFAYLKSIEPVKNIVPQPILPAI